ncbi:MAG: winged helix-turn-helix domain-containing protein [Methanomassiliicoccales archaeon]|jgi:DNA-binding HxlR family transcriptional regulator
MTADHTDIVARLEALQEEIKELSWMISDAKGDEFRRTLSSRMTDLLSETNIQRINSNIDALSASSACPAREECLRKIRMVLALSVDKYKNDDLEGAMISIRELNGILCSTGTPCKDGDCSSVAQTLLMETKLTMEIAEKLKENVSRPKESRNAVESDADDIAKALDPLSYPARVRILQNLSEGESSFSDLSNELGLKTGHLQHHLRPLCDAGYVSRANGRGRYSITIKGRKALDGVCRLVSSLNDA